MPDILLYQLVIPFNSTNKGYHIFDKTLGEANTTKNDSNDRKNSESDYFIA